MQKLDIVTKHDKEITLLEGRAKAVSTKANFKITSQEKLEEANKIMSTLKVAKKFVAEKKARIITPLLLATKNAREMFRPIENELFDAETRLKEGVMGYKRQVDEVVAEQNKKIEEKVEKGETSFEKGSAKMAKVQAKTSQFKTRKVQKMFITDEKKIPRAFLVVNEVALRKALLAGTVVSGAEIRTIEVPFM